jgi:hypothetical protein
MGHRRRRTIFKLKFQDPDLHDLEVYAKKPSMGEQLDTVKLQKLAHLNPGMVTEKDAQDLRQAFLFFGRFIVGWNLEEEDGTPIECTPENILNEEDSYLLAILNAWMEASNGVGVDLKGISNGGLPSVVESIPVETLSANLSSLPEQN